MKKELRVPVDKIEQAQNALTQLAEKGPASLGLRAAVAKLFPAIKAALAQGHTWDDVARCLTETDIVIKGSTLEAYAKDLERALPEPSAAKPKRQRRTPTETGTPTAKPPSANTKPAVLAAFDETA